MGCRMHLVLVDEADKMSAAAQLYLLSKLDSTSFPPDTIFVFTCNSTDGLEPRFISRCGIVEFSAYGTSKDAAALLELVWDAEAPAGADRPNFARIVKDATGNIRASLMALQNELLLA
jgi:DNA polymerase III delta prime subunit